jgi:DNA-directed RNA polymerase subunit omega
MLIKPSITDLLEKVDSRYTLVVETAKRARQLVEGDEKMVECDSANPVTIAAYEVVEDKITYIVKKQPQYPKDYKECCKILNIPFDGNIVYAGHWVYGGKYLEKHLDVLRKFQKLIICRDAYWKIAGEEMGLGNPWEPDWCDTSQSKHSIWFNNEGICIKSNRFSYIIQHILTFPTPEMRYAFHENFKDLINETKELL